MADLDQRTAKAFDFAADVAKQLITLVTAVFGTTVAFAKDIVPHTSAYQRGLLTAGWVLLLLSLLAGVAVLMQLTGQLGSSSPALERPTIYRASIRRAMAAQAVLFLLGLIAIMIAARDAL